MCRKDSLPQEDEKSKGHCQSAGKPSVRAGRTVFAGPGVAPPCLRAGGKFPRRFFRLPSARAMSSRRGEVPRRIAAGTGRHMSGCARLWRDAGRADRGRGQDVLRFLRGKKLVLLSMPVSIIYCVCLGGRGTPRSAVDVRKAPASPNGHGPPGRLSVAAGGGVPLPPKPPIPSPVRFYQGKTGVRGKPAPKGKRSAFSLFALYAKLFAKLVVLTGPEAKYLVSEISVYFTTGYENNPIWTYCLITGPDPR